MSKKNLSARYPIGTVSSCHPQANTMTNIVPQQPGKRKAFRNCLAAQTPGYVEKQSAEIATASVPVAKPEKSDLTVLDFGGKGIRFERRGDRIWVSLTDMAKASGKRVNNWTQLDSTTEFLQAFEGIAGIPVMVSKVGGKPEKTGTWGIEEVAIDFAAWCSVGFRIWVNQQIRSLMTEGTVSIKPKQEQTPPPSQLELPPCDIRLVQMVSTLKDIDFELLNPRFKQGLQDLAADMLGISQPRLEAEKTANREGVWCGVVERAEQLGYPVGLLIEKRTVLGRWVAARITESVKETRLCNGTQRPINIYQVTEVLDAAIVSYFDKLNVKL